MEPLIDSKPIIEKDIRNNAFKMVPFKKIITKTHVLFSIKLNLHFMKLINLRFSVLPVFTILHSLEVTHLIYIVKVTPHAIVNLQSIPKYITLWY